MNVCLRHVLSFLLPITLAAQTPIPSGDHAPSGPVVVQIRVVQGHGAVFNAGARSASAVIVEVTDETGRPVEGAAVSFRLPATGPGGAFPNGLATDVAITDGQGRATAAGVRWSRIPGSFQIRVTTVKGEARAGLVVPAYLADKQPDSAGRGPEIPNLPNPRRKWLTVAIIAGGAVAGSVVAGLVAGNRTPTAQAAAASAASTTLSVGAPVLTIGGPP